MTGCPEHGRSRCAQCHWADGGHTGQVITHVLGVELPVPIIDAVPRRRMYKEELARARARETGWEGVRLR